MKSAPSPWSPWLYSAARFALGTYLAVHFGMLIPWAAELFSSAGLMADGQASPLLRAFPNVLALVDAPAMTTGMAIVGCALSVSVALGFKDRWAAVVAWYILACFLGRNPLILNPSLPHIGWLLLAHAAVPTAPRGSVDGWLDPARAAVWHLPRPLLAAGWIVMSGSYLYSGLTKLISPSWLDGSALRHVLENPLARPSALRDAALALPDSAFAVATWGTLGLELVFPLLACHLRTRPWAWLGMVLMHVGLILLIDFADLSAGMLILHLFTFEPRWLTRSAGGSQPAASSSWSARSPARS